MQLCILEGDGAFCCDCLRTLKRSDRFDSFYHFDSVGCSHGFGFYAVLTFFNCFDNITCFVILISVLTVLPFIAALPSFRTVLAERVLGRCGRFPMLPFTILRCLRGLEDFDSFGQVKFLS